MGENGNKDSHAPIAQMDRVTDYESVGRVFESPWAHLNNKGLGEFRLIPLFFMGSVLYNIAGS